MAVAGKNGKVVIGDDWKSYITGLKEWSASSEGDYEVPVDEEGQAALQKAFLDGATVTVKLYVDEKNYYTGEAYINSLSIEDPVDDVVSISIEFTGTGALSFEKGA